MNRFIGSDIGTGLQYLRIGILNAMDSIEKEEVEEIVLGDFVPFSLVVDCAESRGWKEYEDSDKDIIETNGWEVDCWYYMTTPNGKNVRIESCLFKGQTTKIVIEHG